MVTSGTATTTTAAAEQQQQQQCDASVKKKQEEEEAVGEEEPGKNGGDVVDPQRPETRGSVVMEITGKVRNRTEEDFWIDALLEEWRHAGAAGENVPYLPL